MILLIPIWVILIILTIRIASVYQFQLCVIEMAFTWDPRKMDIDTFQKYLDYTDYVLDKMERKRTEIKMIFSFKPLKITDWFEEDECTFILEHKLPESIN